MGGGVTHELIAAVDLGSNSFRLQVGRVVDHQVYAQDSLKEPVRLAAGLRHNRVLDAAAQRRALAALTRFGERLRGFLPETVRVVATDTFRVARNAAHLIDKGQQALGFPIEVIAGREEARLIYLGVVHTLPDPARRQLVVDIGGGSTEFIVGQGYAPLELESLHLGCVSHTLQYFSSGSVSKKNMKEAELAASNELETIIATYRKLGWQRAIGSSGTAKAIAELLHLNGLNGLNEHNEPACGAGEISRAGLERLKALLFRAGHVDHLHLPGLRADRAAVLPGGLAILSAVFAGFELECMTFSEGALRHGVLHDLVGRHHHDDMRDVTVSQFMQRYVVDRRQAARVADSALALLQQLLPQEDTGHEMEAQFLTWAVRLHEIGISVAHSGYHKHGAYILGNADMPGFSRQDQVRLSGLVLCHRGKLASALEAMPDARDRRMIFCLRLAVLLHRARIEAPGPDVRVSLTKHGMTLTLATAGLAAPGLTMASLEEEVSQWNALDVPMKIRHGKCCRSGAAAPGTR